MANLNLVVFGMPMIIRAMPLLRPEGSMEGRPLPLLPLPGEEDDADYFSGTSPSSDGVLYDYSSMQAHSEALLVSALVASHPSAAAAPAASLGTVSPLALLPAELVELICRRVQLTFDSRSASDIASAYAEDLAVWHWPLLHCVARVGDFRAIYTLCTTAIAAGGAPGGGGTAVDVNMVDGAGNDVTALYRAASAGQRDAVAALLDLGADPTLCDREGATPVFRAAMCGRDECLSLLLAQRLNAMRQPNRHGETAAWAAAENGHSGCITVLSDGGFQDWDVPCSRAGNTASHCAALHGFDDCLRALKLAGADLSIHNSISGATPVFCACARGREATLQLLVGPGFELDPDAATSAEVGSHTPAWIASLNGNPGCLRTLHAAGADLTTPAADGSTPLSVSGGRRRGRFRAVAEFLQSIYAGDGVAGDAVPLP